MSKLLELEGFGEAVRRSSWVGSVAIQIYSGPQVCSSCGNPTVTLEPIIQPPLFAHGGYGEATRTISEICVGCRRSRTTLIEALNPRPFR